MFTCCQLPTTELIRLQLKEVQDVILRALQNNEYFPHSENLHAGVIEDNRRPVRYNVGGRANSGGHGALL